MYIHGGWAKGIPKNSCTEPEVLPFTVASSSLTVSVGAAALRDTQSAKAVES